ncbi:hypothetical protein, partial [Paracidovorax avenae]|uniref:hypothetical protein n=1 Tax=Paracidovorax avenae TaxID=80867 RepID=UPI001F226071
MLNSTLHNSLPEEQLECQPAEGFRRLPPSKQVACQQGLALRPYGNGFVPGGSDNFVIHLCQQPLQALRNVPAHPSPLPELHLRPRQAQAV